ncbi:hypothetical protein CsatA_017489 [Cannabis sativa]
MQSVDILSSVIKLSFKVMNQSLTISRVWKLRRRLTRSDGARQLMVLCFFFRQMTKPYIKY